MPDWFGHTYLGLHFPHTIFRCLNHLKNRHNPRVVVVLRDKRSHNCVFEPGEVPLCTKTRQEKAAIGFALLFVGFLGLAFRFCPLQSMPLVQKYLFEYEPVSLNQMKAVDLCELSVGSVMWMCSIAFGTLTLFSATRAPAPTPASTP